MSWLILISSVYFFLAFWENMVWAGMGITVRKISLFKEVIHVLIYLVFAFFSLWLFKSGFPMGWFLAASFFSFVIYALFYLTRVFKRGTKEEVSVAFKMSSAVIKLIFGTGFLLLYFLVKIG